VHNAQSDYAMLIKLFGSRDISGPDWYGTTNKVIGTVPKGMNGRPDPRYISTSHIERSNLTLRMQLRKFTRLTNAHSRKLENLKYAVVLYIAWYNLVAFIKRCASLLRGGVHRSSMDSWGTAMPMTRYQWITVPRDVDSESAKETNIGDFAPHHAFAAKRQTKLIIIALFFALGAPLAMTQMKSGTVIIIFFSKEKVILAGDSRVIEVGEGTKRSYRDDECKIFALNNKIIYAASGMIGHDFSPRETGAAWDAHREAMQIASSATDIKTIADAWAARIKQLIDADFVNYPQLFEAALRTKTFLVSAVFAGLDADNKLSVYSVVLTCDCHPFHKSARVDVGPRPPTDDGLPVGIMAKQEATVVFNELIAGKTPRSNLERKRWTSLSRKKRETAITIRSVEFIIKNAATDEIGGAVDALEIDASGRIRWIQRKKNCPQQ
jgi:hypothetical protein